MPRTTRSSSRGRTIREELKTEGQSQVTDYFKTTRRGRKPTGKDVAKSDQADVVTIPSQITSLPSPPKVKRISTSPPKPKPAARKLFDDSPDVKETASSSIETKKEEITTPTRKAKPIRNVAQLQKILAQKGSLQRLHDQAIESKVERVLHNAEVLKSPQKLVPRALKVVDVPDYVLPKSPKKKQGEKREEKQERQEEIVGVEYKKKTSLLKPEVRDSASIPLPKAYQLLHEKFQSGDRILSIMMQQGKRITFDEMADNVRKALKRDFTKKDFARFVHLYKEAFLVNLEKGWMAFGGAKKGWDLVIRPNLKDDLNDWMLDLESSLDSVDTLPMCTPSMLCSPTKGQPGGVPKSPKKTPCQPLPRVPQIDGSERLEGWRMLCRAQIFRHLLTKLVHEAHSAFLSTIGVELKKKPLRLHPQFQLETCPDVAEAKLPEPPQNEFTPKTMADYMNEVGVAVNLEGVKRVLTELASPQKATKDGVPLSPRKFANKQAAEMAKTGGVNSILARIRAKEAAKKAAMVPIDPVKEKRISRIDRLLIGALRTLTGLFALKKTYSLHLSVVVNKMIQTIRFLGYDEAVSCLELLCEVSPKNVEMAEVAGQKYLKIIDNDYEKISADLMEEKKLLTS